MRNLHSYVFFTFEALRIDSQKTNTYVHVPYDVRHLSTAFVQLIKPCYKQKSGKKHLQTYTFLSFYESVFSHLRHLELTHRKLTHMYMFLMMSGIFLQHCPVQLIKPCYKQKNCGKKHVTNLYFFVIL